MKNAIKRLVLLTVWSVTIVSVRAAFDPVAGEGFVSAGEIETALGIKKGELRKVAPSLQFRFVHSVTWFWECQPTGGGEIESLSSQSFLLDSLDTLISRRGKAGVLLGIALSSGLVLIGDPEIFPGTCPEGSELVGEVLSSTEDRLEVSLDGHVWVTLSLAVGH